MGSLINQGFPFLCLYFLNLYLEQYALIAYLIFNEDQITPHLLNYTIMARIIKKLKISKKYDKICYINIGVINIFTEGVTAMRNRTTLLRAEHGLTAPFLHLAAAARLKLNTIFVMDNRRI